MSFYSSTKSWQACNGDQQNECKAHAVFTRLYGFPAAAEAYIVDIRAALLRKIKQLKEKQPDKLTKEEKDFVALQGEIDHMGDISKLETLFPKIKNFVDARGVGKMGTKDVLALLERRELSKIIKAMKRFSWSGGSSKLPNGKTASELGVTEALLDELMAKYNGDALLDSWLFAGDENWRRSIEPYIESRKTELAYLKRTNPSDNKIKILEFEIERLEKDWHL